MSGEHHPADARREAEEALGRVLANAAAIVRLSWSDGATAADCANLERIKSAAADIAQDHKILRSLLAALPAEGEAEAREYGPCPAYRDGEPHAGCDLCGGFGALPILSEADLATAPLSLPCPVCGPVTRLALPLPTDYPEPQP